MQYPEICELDQCTSRDTAPQNDVGALVNGRDAVLYSRTTSMGNEFQTDLAGRVRNVRLPPSRALVSVFEAVVNSLHSIEEAGRKDGRVAIEVLRKPANARGAQQSLSLPENETRQPIIGFRVRDNGIGFTKANYTSFCTSDSGHKLDIGGRGIGRFTWLKVFERVTIDSRYRQGKSMRRRTFTFSVRNGISAEKDVANKTLDVVGTDVVLDGIRDAYQDHFPKRTRTIGQHIVDHCFAAIRATKHPVQVELIDGDDVWDISAEALDMFSSALRDEVTICGRTFELTHIRVASSEVSSHKLVFMADRREVRAENLGASIPQLRFRLDGDGGRPSWWWTLVESKALDKAVTSERDGFDFPDDEALPHMLSLQAIRKKAVVVVSERVKPLIEPIIERTQAQVRAYVEGEAPEYRHVARMRPDAVAAFPPDLPKDKLDAELHRLNYEIEVSLRAQCAKVLNTDTVDESTYEQFLSDENAIGKANLAKYVVHRRRVIDLYRRALGKNAAGAYSLEQTVHRLVFPLQKTSDEVPYHELNLWMIDERLAYHYYLASDKELRSLEVLDNDSAQRPDIIGFNSPVFNSPFAFSDQDSPFSSVVIVEFKRPARDDYTDEKNPIKQVYDYVRKIRSGRAFDRSGRPMHVPEHVPFYCYIVCDMTPRLVELAENVDLSKTPDAEGYYGFNNSLRAYIEVLSFSKLVSDAEKRNRVLFEKLNLPR